MPLRLERNLPCAYCIVRHVISSAPIMSGRDRHSQDSISRITSIRRTLVSMCVTVTIVCACMHNTLLWITVKFVYSQGDFAFCVAFAYCRIVIPSRDRIHLYVHVSIGYADRLMYKCLRYPELLYIFSLNTSLNYPKYEQLILWISTQLSLVALAYIRRAIWTGQQHAKEPTSRTHIHLRLCFVTIYDSVLTVLSVMSVIKSIYMMVRSCYHVVVNITVQFASCETTSWQKSKLLSVASVQRTQTCISHMYSICILIIAIWRVR
jgi:hypothetical protein